MFQPKWHKKIWVWQCVWIRLQTMLKASQTYFSAAEEQENTGHTLVPTGSLGIQDGVCWRNKNGTPPDGMRKHKIFYCSPYFTTAIVFSLPIFNLMLISWSVFMYSLIIHFAALMFWFQNLHLFLKGERLFLPNPTTFCHLTFPHARQWCRLHVRVNSQVQIIHMVVRGSGIHIGALDPKEAPSAQSLSCTWILRKTTGVDCHCSYILYKIELFVFVTISQAHTLLTGNV